MKIKRRKNEIDASLNVIENEIIRNILANRNITKIEDVEADIRGLLHYRDLKDIDIASSILKEAIRTDKKIIVFGDYDVDGMTGTALGVLGLKSLGAKNVDYLIPSRYASGYGMSIELVKVAIEKDVDLIVTVDNGISCHDAISFARDNNIDVIVTDHHDVTDILPNANAIINPKRLDCNFPSKNLCGAGVLFYLLIATRALLIEENFYEEPPPQLNSFLDLVAIATIGDVVPLDLNNRRLVKAGLNRLKKGLCQVGIKALSSFAKFDLKNITTHNISFDICPRLNAASRIYLPDNPSILLLLSQDEEEALTLAKRLDYCNKRRHDYEKVFLAEAIEEAKTQDNRKSLVVFKKHWLSGLSGLLASRLKDQFQKPVFVFAGEGDEITGSARSVTNFPLSKILNLINEKHDDLLIRFGGHAMAAGVSIKVENLEKFKEIFEEIANENLDVKEESVIETDGVLPNECFNIEFAKLLASYGPYGHGFEEPLFDNTFTVLDSKILGSRHLRLRLSNGFITITALKFRATQREISIQEGTVVDVVFAITVDRYYDQEKLLVRIEEFDYHDSNSILINCSDDIEDMDDDLLLS